MRLVALARRLVLELAAPVVQHGRELVKVLQQLAERVAVARPIDKPEPTPEPAAKEEPAEPEAPKIPEGMIRIAPDHYRLGGDKAKKNPARVTRLDPFFIDRDEVTNESYGGCVKARKCRKSKQAKNKRLNAPLQPVVGVRFKDAKAFCAWNGDKRLPSPDEWEAAARGEGSTTFPWGDKFVGKRANVAGREDGHAKTAPVGSFATGNTLLGIRDMAGNAAEWVSDSHKTGFVRGGSYQSPPETTAAAELHKVKSKRKGHKTVGFRCAKADD